MTDMVRPITVEEFMESMKYWIMVSIRRSVRRGDPTFECEDLMQEARYSLLEVVRDYPEKFAEGKMNELQKIGRRAIFYHTGNMHHSAKSARHGGGVSVVPVVPGDEHVGKNPEAGKVIYEAHLRDRSFHCDTALDGLIVRETVDKIFSESGEARVLFEYLDTNPAGPLPSGEAMKIFRRVKKKVRGVFFRDGYMGVSAVNQPNEEGHMLNDTGPVSPDNALVTKTKVAAEVEAAVRRAPAKPAKDGATAKARQNAAETAKASSAFRKGQKVMYVGNGRASWLKAGTELEVKGTVVSRGRTYVRCYAIKAKRKVSLSSALLKK